MDLRSPAVPLTLLAGAVFYLSNGYTELMGSDTWWHIAAGRELLQTGSLWMVDDWSYSAHGRDWLNHEWLADIVYYAWVSLGGLESLVYWKWLVVVATFLVLQLVLVRQTGNHLAGLLCSALAISIGAPFLDVRPHLYSLLNFGLLLLLLLDRRPNPWLLAPLFFVWVNLHGGFFFGLLAAAILVFPWRDFSAQRLRAALVAGLVCLGAASLNPHGISAFLYPLKYAFDESSPFRQLGEWLPPYSPGGIVSPLFFIFMWAPFAAVLYLVPRVRRSVEMPIEGILLTALTLAMALTSRRFIPLFGMSLALMIAPLVGVMLDRLCSRRAGLVLSVAALGYALYRLAPYPLASGPAFHYLLAEYSFPVDTLNFVESNGIEGRVYALYNWGGYLHWRTDGGLRVFIDGRADTLYDADTYRHYTRVLGSGDGWIGLIESSGAEFVLWPNLDKDGQAKMRALLATGRWRAVFQDSVSWLLARRTVSLPDNLQPSPQSPWRDLALGQFAIWRGDTEKALTHGEKVRDAIPWHRGACALLSRTHLFMGNTGEAERIIAECRAYFPSRYLR